MKGCLMAKKIVTIGLCEGVENILSQKGYSVEHVEQKKILDILKKEEVEAVIVDVDDTVKSNVVISGIRHLYPGLWIAVISNIRRGIYSGCKKPTFPNYP